VLVPGLLAALTLGSAPAGPTEAIELRWQAPAGCPAGAQAQDLVGRLVSGPDASVRAVVTIDAMAEGFEGTLELQTNANRVTRRLQADDCMVLTRAMAVVIAVGLDPMAVVGATQTAMPEPESMGSQPLARETELARGQPVTPGPSARVAASELDSRRTIRPEPRRRGKHGGLEAGARLGAGVGGLLFPAAGVGLSLAPFVGTTRFHARAVVQYWAPQRIAFDPERDASGELQLVSGGLRACPQLEWTRLRVPLCAGVDAGAMIGRGTGRDLAIPRSAREPWVGAVLEPGLTVRVTSRVSLWLALEGVVSLYRPRFAIEGTPRPWTAGAGALRGLFGVQVHWRRDRPQNP
jgi:hypothetical protein